MGNYDIKRPLKYEWFLQSRRINHRLDIFFQDQDILDDSFQISSMYWIYYFRYIVVNGILQKASIMAILGLH